MAENKGPPTNAKGEFVRGGEHTVSVIIPS